MRGANPCPEVVMRAAKLTYPWYAKSAPARRLVPKVPAGREHHRDARAVAGLDHVLVALRAARLDDRPHAGLDRQLGAVRKREERVRREGRADEVAPRFLDREPHRVDPAHLARADAR